MSCFLKLQAQFPGFKFCIGVQHMLFHKALCGLSSAQLVLLTIKADKSSRVEAAQLILIAVHFSMLLFVFCFTVEQHLCCFTFEGFPDRAVANICMTLLQTFVRYIFAYRYVYIQTPYKFISLLAEQESSVIMFTCQHLSGSIPFEPSHRYIS